MSAFGGKTDIACKAVAAANSDRSFGVLIDIEHGGHDDTISALHDHLRRPGIILAATGWTTLAVPLIFGVSCLVAGLDNIHRICFWGSCCRLLLRR